MYLTKRDLSAPMMYKIARYASEAFFIGVSNLVIDYWVADGDGIYFSQFSVYQFLTGCVTTSFLF